MLVLKSGRGTGTGRGTWARSSQRGKWCVRRAWRRSRISAFSSQGPAYVGVPSSTSRVTDSLEGLPELKKASMLTVMGQDLGETRRQLPVVLPQGVHTNSTQFSRRYVVEHVEHLQTGRLTRAVSSVFTEVGHMAPADDLCCCLSFSVSSPSRGHTVTARPKAPISHLVGVDCPVWPKAPGKARHSKAGCS